MHDDDPDVAWLRHQVDQILDPPRGLGRHVPLVAALTTSLAFLSLLLALALAAPL